MTTFEDFSIDNSVSKGSLYEDDTFTGAAMEDALQQIDRSISDEVITNGTRLLDTYQVSSDAIPGGMGEVWKVHHDTWNVDLALKRPQPKFFSEGGPAKKKAFIKECENWITLGLHPNIVSCYYVREIGGVPSIFSEWMDNGSLSDRIKDGLLYDGSADDVQERILDIAIQSAWGLSYSHEHNMTHQDVKPGNILLTGDWDTKVADFGLAQATVAAGIDTASSDERNHDSNTPPKSLGYSLRYCPAEQVEAKEAQPWMDIYSWAVTVLEMYTRGRKWETGAQVKKDFDRFLSSIPDAIPEGMSSLLEKCIRYSSELAFPDVIPELEQIYTQTTQHAYPRPRPRAAADSADSLNNYALSYYDLGKIEKALILVQKAYEKDSRNLNAAYNAALMGYRQGLLDDLAAIAQVSALVPPGQNTPGQDSQEDSSLRQDSPGQNSSGQDSSDPLLALARIQAECRDKSLADTLNKMDQLFPDTNREELSFLREELSRNKVKEIYHYKNPQSGMVEISPDGALLAVHQSDMQKAESVQFLRADDLKECSTVTRIPDAFEPAEARIKISRDHQYCFGSYMKDPYVYRWRIADGEQTIALVMRKLPGETIVAYDCDETGTNTIVASNRGRLAFKNNESGESKALEPVSGNFSVDMSSGGTCGLVSLYEHDKVLLHGFTDDRYLEIDVKKPAYSAFVLGDDAILTVSEELPPKLCLHDAVTGDCRYKVPFPRYNEFTGRMRQVSLSCDGSRIMFGMNAGFLLFSIRDHRWLFTLSQKDTEIHRNLIVKGYLVGDGSRIYLSSFSDNLNGFRLPEFTETAPWLLSRIRSVRRNLEEEDQFNSLCADAQAALDAVQIQTAPDTSKIQTALHSLEEAGKVGSGKFKTELIYRTLVRNISPYCSILKLRHPYEVDRHPVFRDPVFSMSASPDGKWICALSEAGEMAVLDASTCEIVYRGPYRRHAHMRKIQWAGSTFYSIVIGANRNPFSKDGDKHLKVDDGSPLGGSMGISFRGLDLAGSPGGSVYAFDMERVAEFDRMKPFLEDNDITDILAAENGTVFYCRRCQGEIFRYTKGAGKKHLFFSGEDYQVTGSAISPDGSIALQNLGDIMNFKKEKTSSSLTLLYDTRTGKIKLTSAKVGATPSCAFTNDGKYAAAGNNIFDLGDGSVRQFDYDRECFVSILENNYLIAFGVNGLLRAYDLRAGDLLLETAVDEKPSSLECSPDRNTLYIGNSKGEIAVWCWDHVYRVREQGEAIVAGMKDEAGEEMRDPVEISVTTPERVPEKASEKKEKPSIWKRLFGSFK